MELPIVREPSVARNLSLRDMEAFWKKNIFTSLLSPSCDEYPFCKFRFDSRKPFLLFTSLMHLLRIFFGDSRSYRATQHVATKRNIDIQSRLLRATPKIRDLPSCCSKSLHIYIIAHTPYCIVPAPSRDHPWHLSVPQN